jgi:hypothetical protein
LFPESKLGFIQRDKAIGIARARWTHPPLLVVDIRHRHPITFNAHHMKSTLCSRYPFHERAHVTMDDAIKMPNGEILASCDLGKLPTGPRVLSQLVSIMR